MEGNEIKSQQGQSNISHESQETAAPFEKLAKSAAVGGAKELAAVVEELRSLHDHQTDLVTQLLSELSSTEKENSLLKAQVNILLNHKKTAIEVIFIPFGLALNIKNRLFSHTP